EARTPSRRSGSSSRGGRARPAATAEADTRGSWPTPSVPFTSLRVDDLHLLQRDLVERSELVHVRDVVRVGEVVAEISPRHDRHVLRQDVLGFLTRGDPVDSGTRPVPL